MTVMILLWSKFKGWVVGAGAALALLGAAWLKGRKAGVDAIKAEQEARAARAAQRKREITDETASLGNADLDRQLDKWVRKP